MHKIIISFLLASRLYAQEYKTVDMESGLEINNMVSEQRDVFKFNSLKLGGTGCGILIKKSNGNPTSEIYAMSKKAMLVIGCTKIKNEYPQDDKLIDLKIVPQIKLYEEMGHGYYKGEERHEFDRKIVWECNTAADLKGPNDLPFVIQSNGFSPNKTNQIRIDRHFIKNGYYIQVVAFSKDDPDDNASFAETLNLSICKEITDK